MFRLCLVLRKFEGKWKERKWRGKVKGKKSEGKFVLSICWFL